MPDRSRFFPFPGSDLDKAVRQLAARGPAAGKTPQQLIEDLGYEPQDVIDLEHREELTPSQALLIGVAAERGLDDEPPEGETFGFNAEELEVLDTEEPRSPISLAFTLGVIAEKFRDEDPPEVTLGATMAGAAASRISEATGIPVEVLMPQDEGPSDDDPEFKPGE